MRLERLDDRNAKPEEKKKRGKREEGGRQSIYTLQETVGDCTSSVATGQVLRQDS